MKIEIKIEIKLKIYIQNKIKIEIKITIMYYKIPSSTNGIKLVLTNFEDSKGDIMLTWFIFLAVTKAEWDRSYPGISAVLSPEL